MPQNKQPIFYLPYVIGAFLLLSYVAYRHQGSSSAIKPLNSNYEDDFYTEAADELPKPASAKFNDISNVATSFAPYNPYPDYNSHAWKKRWHGTHKACLGPRGVSVNNNPDDMLVAHSVAHGLEPNPGPMFGSYIETGIDSDHCFEREGRLGAYGYEEVDGSSRVQKVNWNQTNWGSLQAQCIASNADRYDTEKESRSTFWHPREEDFAEAKASQEIGYFEGQEQGKLQATQETRPSSTVKRYKPRNAVIFRGYEGMEYKPDILHMLRSLVMELNLHSGGEYTVYLMVQIFSEPSLLSNPNAYQAALEANVPAEFRNMTILFNSDLLWAWYPSLKDATNHARYRMQQPLQLFSLLHPEYEHVWMLEGDCRYTGHWYNLFENAGTWARAQPRKLQWERAAEFFIPSYHNTYANFTHLIEDHNPNGGIWGPVEDEAVRHPAGPKPPRHKPSLDDYSWGVGEEADLISMSVVVDGTNVDVFVNEPQAGFPSEEKRLTVVPTVFRVSKKHLRIMHAAQVAQGAQYVPEFFLHTLALFHGLKIAAFPMPTYYSPIEGVADDPPTMQSIFNTPKGKDSPFQREKPQVNIDMFDQITYWWVQDSPAIQFASRLYRRWLGLHGDGPEDVGNEDPGRLCVPGILLHPVKFTDRRSSLDKYA